MTKFNWEKSRRQVSVSHGAEYIAQSKKIRHALCSYTGRSNFLLSMKEKCNNPSFVMSWKQIEAVRSILKME